MKTDTSEYSSRKLASWVYTLTVYVFVCARQKRDIQFGPISVSSFMEYFLGSPPILKCYCIWTIVSSTVTVWLGHFISRNQSHQWQVNCTFSVTVWCNQRWQTAALTVQWIDIHSSKAGAAVSRWGIIEDAVKPHSNHTVVASPNTNKTVVRMS